MHSSHPHQLPEPSPRLAAPVARAWSQVWIRPLELALSCLSAEASLPAARVPLAAQVLPEPEAQDQPAEVPEVPQAVPPAEFLS